VPLSKLFLISLVYCGRRRQAPWTFASSLGLQGAAHLVEVPFEFLVECFVSVVDVGDVFVLFLAYTRPLGPLVDAEKGKNVSQLAEDEGRSGRCELDILDIDVVDDSVNRFFRGLVV